MNIEYLQQKRKSLGITYAELSERTGIPKSTLTKIFTGVTPNPREDTATAIERALGTFESEKAEPITAVADEEYLIECYRKLSTRERLTLFKIMQAAFEPLQNINVDNIAEYLNKRTRGRKPNDIANNQNISS